MDNNNPFKNIEQSWRAFAEANGIGSAEEAALQAEVDREVTELQGTMTAEQQLNEL